MASKQFNFDYTNLREINSKLLYITKAHYATDWHSIMHNHPFTEIFYCISGKGKFHVEDECFDVSQDDLVIVNANVNHTESSKESEPLEYVVLGIEGISIDLPNKKLGKLYSVHNYYDYKHEVLFYIKTLLLEAKNKSSYYDLISQNLLEILIYNIIRRAEGKLAINESSKTNHLLMYIKEYIESHYSEKITLDRLCEISYINKFYLVHIFKENYGFTPIQYLNKIRLENACLLLKNTDHSIGDITRFIGIESQSYFTQCFKKTYNLSPNEYRKIQKRLN